MSDPHSERMEGHDLKSREGAHGVQNSAPPGAKNEKWLSELRFKRAGQLVTMRAWPVARAAYSMLCERSERAGNKLDKPVGY